MCFILLESVLPGIVTTVHCEKLIVDMLVKFPAFYGSEFSKDSHHSLFWLQSTPSHHSHLPLCIRNSLFPSGFPTNILWAFHMPHACYLSHPFRSWCFITLYISLFRFEYSVQYPVTLTPLKTSHNYCLTLWRRMVTICTSSFDSQLTLRFIFMGSARFSV
jgi:hypothetical protein